MADLADVAAAQAAGYAVTRWGFAGSFYTRLEKNVVGQPGSSADLVTADGVSTVDSATADTNAVAALNNQRMHKWGLSNPDLGEQGTTLTEDVT